jgi:hypothetical protein
LHAFRYRKLKQLHSLGRSRAAGSTGKQGSRPPLTLLCKDEDMGQLAVITFLERGSPQVQAFEAEILNMRACNAHPFSMHPYTRWTLNFVSSAHAGMSHAPCHILHGKS